jgi:uncharacterized protein YjbJ (UPF0337 family)
VARDGGIRQKSTTRGAAVAFKLQLFEVEGGSMNKNNRTDAEEAVANQAGGVLNQIKGRVKQAAGDLTGDHSMHASGTKDRIKGNLQEAYGNIKEKEDEIERKLGVDDDRI